MVLFIVFVTLILFLSPIESNFVNHSREKRKHHHEIAEFDVPTEEKSSLRNIVQLIGNFAKNIGEKLETNLGRTYEFLGHKVADVGTQLEKNQENISEKAAKFYNGTFANKTSFLYENFQIGYGKMGDGLSSLLQWLGQIIIKLGHNSGSIIRISFQIIGNIIGTTVDKVENFIGTVLIRSGEKVHTSAIDLQRTSHTDSENLRHKIEETAPRLKHSLTRLIHKLGNKIHTIGDDTETAGEIIEQHHFFDTVKQAYHK